MEFKGIEGIRGWLAWTVVISHLAQLFEPPAAKLLQVAGDTSVEVFIVISGFVITHLIVEKKEPFGLFIARRFLRIYPVYLVALAASIVVLPFFYVVFPGLSGDISAPMVSFLQGEQQQFSSNFWPHLFAHLLLLHGAIPNNILPGSQYMFLGPAWSLSLEWQFYLIAPLWVLAMRRNPTLATALVLIAAIIYKLVFARWFFNPSFLPGAGLMFLLGMATRFLLPMAPQLKLYPYSIVLGLAGFAVLDSRFLFLSIWAALIAYLLQPQKWSLLDSPIARAAGARSYVVYILHAPILYLVVVAAAKAHLSGASLTSFVVATALFSIVLASEVVHRWIEVPAIRLGRATSFRNHSMASAGTGTVRH